VEVNSSTHHVVEDEVEEITQGHQQLLDQSKLVGAVNNYQLRTEEESTAQSQPPSQ
jgi:hypothetical protein